MATFGSSTTELFGISLLRGCAAEEGNLEEVRLFLSSVSHFLSIRSSLLSLMSLLLLDILSEIQTF